MSSDELLRLKEFMNNTDYPLLVSNFPSELYEGAVTLESDIDVTLLNGHYEGTCSFMYGTTARVQLKTALTLSSIILSKSDSV